MAKYRLNQEEYARIARQAVAEGCVLLKNDNQALPIRKGEKIAVFGRSAFNYFKSGIGSGGLVNTRYVVSILDALRNDENIQVDEEILKVYEKWIVEHPFDEGQGWGKVPWSQEEMPVTDELAAMAKGADAAIVIVGRTAGEDQDNGNRPGSYLLTDTEKEMIQKVCAAHPRTIVLLNVGNIIDMQWVKEYNPAAVMYVWQGGQEGGNGVHDVITGAVNPCGKLTDTITHSIEDHPSTSNFGDPEKNVYEEDIFVGYRYFETFAKDAVAYPFGFGLSYTSFAINSKVVEVKDGEVFVEACVKNTGACAGKEVVQVYVSAPCGKLGKAARVLAAFDKTESLEPGQTQVLNMSFPISYFASFDDLGVTGHKSCFVLEEGTYEVYMGSDVRSAVLSGSWEQEFVVVEQLDSAYVPSEEMHRLKAVTKEDGSMELTKEALPLQNNPEPEHMRILKSKEIPYTGDKRIKLVDVMEDRASMDDFIAQLSDDDLIHLFRGEGMCSPKVTPGVAAAFGGLTDRLQEFGVPAACCSDGPSGIRMDCGTKAFSLPNGTALGSSFNLKLVGELFEMLGMELRKNKIDTILGPGMNIHRNPLNGRNFEYISEDPILTGKICAAELLGMERYGVTGTIKHFCGNNQEHMRYSVDAIISERALREIYLKGFEIAVKEGKARSIMTTYGPVNGIWTAGSFDLNTWILRHEWKFNGIVMSDWWANANNPGEKAYKENRAPMVTAQNDLFMVCQDTIKESDNDNVKSEFEAGRVSRGDLQRNAANILHFIMNSPAMEYYTGKADRHEFEVDEEEEDVIDLENLAYYTPDANGKITVDAKDIDCGNGKSHMFGLTIEQEGEYLIKIRLKSDLTELAQLPISVYMDNIYRSTISFQGSNGAYVEKEGSAGHMQGMHHYVRLVFGANGMQLDTIEIYPA